MLFSLSGTHAWAKAKADPKAAPLAPLKLVAGDEKGNEAKSLQAELLVSSTEKKAIVQLQKLIKKYRGKPLEVELNFRLAELYMRKSKTDRFFEIHRESDTVVHIAPRVVKEASSKDSVQKAVDTYTLIEAKYPDYSQTDLVIFNHAFACQILAQDKEAERLYWQLIKKYSNSLLVPDAQLAIGEIAFTRGELPAALEHFMAIRKFPESRVYPYGLYKAAWTYYNMRDTERGLKKLEEVVAYGHFVAQNKIEARLDLRKEALNDMVLFFEDVYPSKEAYQYFRQQAGDVDVGPIILRLGTMYERHSRFDDQRVVLDQFISVSPHSPILAQVHMDLVTALDHLHKKDQAIQHLQKFADLCASNSSWIKGIAKSSEETKDMAGKCRASLDEVSLKMAKKWLKAWKKLPSDTTYADASEAAFAIYLNTSTRNEEYAQSRFVYAEMLFSRQKFRQASVEYAAVGHLTTGSVEKIQHDSSYGALISLEKAAGEKWSNGDEKNFHQLAQDYLSKNPNGQYRLDIEYKMALLAYEKERYAEAASMFLRLGRQFPNQEKGVKAQDLYLDILNIKKDYGGIKSYTSEVLKVTSDTARADKLRRLYEHAFFLEVQSSEEHGHNMEALLGYLTFIKQNSKSEFCEQATWNAMLLHYKMGDAWNGAKVAEDFATKFPKSGQAVNSLLRATQTFEQMGQLGEAARVLIKLAAADQKSARRWQELAADFYALDGQTAAARKLYGELHSSGESVQRLTLLKKRETLEKNYGTATSHQEVVKTLVDQNVQPYVGEYRAAATEHMLENGKNTEAFAEARRHLGATSSRNEKARMRMVQAKVLEQEFLKQSVKAHAERVATVLALKTEKLSKAQEAFQDAIKYGDSRVSIEAFEHLNACYVHYVKALKEMPIPAGLTEADSKAFRAELERLVIPLEEKSVDAINQALNFTRKQNYLDGTVARLERKLADLNQLPRLDIEIPVSKPEMALPILTAETHQ